MSISNRIGLPFKYFILFLLVAQAGFPFFVGNLVLGLIAGFTLIVFFLDGHKFNKFSYMTIISLIVLMLAQIITTNYFILGPFFGIIFRIIYAIAAIKIIGLEFNKYYIKFMYFFAILSLFLWAILSSSSEIYNTFNEFAHNVIQPLALFPEFVRTNIIIYTNDYWLLNNFPRNAGPFWEPGAFGVFLNLAIMFNTLETGKILNKKNIVFIIALISTFSLGAYIAFFIFLYSLIFFVRKIFTFSSIVSFALISLIGIYSYNTFEFLGDKVESSLVKVSTFNSDLTYNDIYYQVGRNEQAILDLNSFYKFPLFGEGQFIEYAYAASASGLTSILRKWGIIGFLMIFVTMYFSFMKYIKIKMLDKNYIKVILFTFMSVSISQSLFGLPFFLGFIFMYFIFDSNENTHYVINKNL
ncbi:MAG: hypothetical protein KF816_10015 [Melioribacteraceae bacterium]|nr:hypothetical protein [Melioribacteraceae bacterium]